MLVSYKWLQDYVEIPWKPEELAERLTMAGLEVEGITPLAPDLEGVYVGLVQEVKDHPSAENLKVCSVDVGSRGSFSIICGAPNVAAGQKVPVALAGAVLPGLTIQPTEIRGVLSEGMICSQAELGISDDHAGIWVLPEDVPLGQSLVAAVGLDDVVLDVSVYANRPDCMSVIGIAREIAAFGDPTQAAISPPLAADIYGLQVLAEDVEDEDHNTTRFVVLSKEFVQAPADNGPVVTSFVFNVRNLPAALYKALGGFATNGVNMTKLESYMVGGMFSATQFLAEVDGHPDDTAVRNALEELDFFTTEVKILGSYPADPYRTHSDH
mgnify:CR=1 FL=1